MLFPRGGWDGRGACHRGKDDRKLPVSHTCFFHVELPDYSTEERMRWGMTIGE
jgi:hypothetical protein